MLLYSYIFDKVYKWYLKSKDSTPSLYAVLIISLMQACTIFLTILLPIRLKDEKLNIANWIVFVIALIIIGINYFYFNIINNPKKIEEKIKSLSVSKNHQFSNRNRIWFMVFLISACLLAFFYMIDKYVYSLLLIPIDGVILMFNRTIFFNENEVVLMNNTNPFSKVKTFSYENIKEISPLTRPAGFKIRFNNGVGSEFFFSNGDELRPFYSLLVKNKVKINPKDFTYISNLIAELKKEINR